MVNVELGPGDVDTGKDLDVGELRGGGVFEALELFARDQEAAAGV